MARDIPFVRRSPRRWARLVLALALAPQLGCTREFFRNWANQDATEGIFEKSRDPRWRLDMYSAEPPALSRFANPYDPDFPPAPPDDFAAQALSPVPQWPKFRLLNPMEGTGYLDMLEAARRDRPVINRDRDADGPKPPSVVPQPTPPQEPSPFRLGSPDMLEPTLSPEGGSDSAPNFGPGRDGMTPSNGGDRPAIPSTPPQARRAPPKDPNVFMARLQEGNMPPPDAPATPGQRPRVRVTNDPEPDVGVRPDEDPDAPLGATEAGGELEKKLTAPIPFKFAQEIAAAGLAPGDKPYVVGPREALELALINSRTYQFRLEGVLLTALPVTLQRFSFEPQFYAGLPPIQSPPGVGLPPGGGINQWLYRTKEAPGGQISQLNLSTVAGFGKLFTSGLRLAGGIANTTIFQFTGQTARQPTVQSLLPLTLTQPFLRGGGRAVTMEPLTQAERNLLYEVRNFARFRQEFFVNILTAAGQGFGSASLSGGVNAADPSIGYLNLVTSLQQVENNLKTTVAFERVLEIQKGLGEGAGSNVSSLDIDQVDSNLQRQRITLLNSQINYRNNLDQYRIQLGLPPDVPLVPDYAIMSVFSRVFEQIADLAAKDRESLERLVGDLPELEDVVIDGRSVFAAADERIELENILLAAERVALENRLDLMNERASLYDVWRQIRIADNALKGVFNVTVTNQVFTPPTTANPFAFLDQSKQFSLVLNGELPLVRLNERNNFRTALINYERRRRFLMAQEDTVKFQVRQGVRNLIQFYKQYELQKRTCVASLRQADQSLKNLFGPQAAGAGGGGQGGTQTNLYTQAQSQIVQAQNGIVTAWTSYQTSRLGLYDDLGILPYDEWEAFDEFFPATTNSTRVQPPGNPGSPPVAGGPARPGPAVVPGS